jgi:cytochrome c oxidase cbb3-type subunit 3
MRWPSGWETRSEPSSVSASSSNVYVVEQHPRAAMAVATDMSEAVTRLDFAKKRRGVNRLWLLFGGLPLLMPIASLTLLAQASPARSPGEALAERDAGEQAFAVQCAYCHGPTAEGAIGPALTSPQLRWAPDETTLAQVIRNGIPGTGMPASAVSESQARQISAYVWSLGHRNRSAAHGDVRRGQEIFEGKGRCVQCHTVAGRGGALGPELGNIGARRDVDELRNSLVDPDAVVVVGFVKTRVTTADGTTLTGVRLNEDSFSIQIRDTSNKFHSFWKSELRQIEKELDRSLMPSSRDTLSADEREDVVSYLISLGPKQ